MIRLSHVVLATLGMTGVAFADSPPEKLHKLGLDAAFVLPVDDYADGVDAAFGLFGRVELAVSSQVFATGRIGYLYNLVDDGGSDIDVNLSMIPIYGGVRYSFSPGGNGAFLAAEAGINIIRASVDFMGTELSDSETKLSLNVGAGYRADKLTFKGTLFLTPDVGDVDGGDGGDGGTNLFGLMATVGFDIAAL